jgi:uncharacterized protein with NRDE domain
MCLIAWNWEPGTSGHLTLAANRDEFYGRPTQALHWWEGNSVLAGRDLSGGGTWLGVTRNGRMAALTNFRDPQGFREDASSRGKLVADFLLGTQSATDYLNAVLQAVQSYNAFNLLVWDGEFLMGLESRHKHFFPMDPGVGAVSNADFMTPWPKLERLRAGLMQAQGLVLPAQEQTFWNLLSDEQVAPDEQLPATGIPLERERVLSPAFIRTPDYGTRSSTLLRLDSGGLWMKERRFDYLGLTGTSAFTS